jgi:RNA polymerase sigma-70 factor, ECF subfamily
VLAVSCDGLGRQPRVPRAARGTDFCRRVYNRRVDDALGDEAQTIARSAEGDPGAFGVLVGRYQEVVFRAAYLIVRDAGAAEDVAQEAFIRAYRQLRTFRQGEPFRPWLLRIVTNLALNEVRARGRRAGLLARVASMTGRDPTPAPHTQVEAGDDASALLRAIGELPEDDRVVLHLRYFLELPEREIAAAIGKPPGTVKSRLHRAGKRLRAVVETKYPQLMELVDG